MDYKRAVYSHMAWIGDFKHRIGRGEIIEPEEAGRSDACEIGRWIGRQSDDYGDIPEFKAVCETHEAFHACVSSALEEAQKGDPGGALDLLDESGLCVGLSRNLLDTLAVLFERTGETTDDEI